MESFRKCLSAEKAGGNAGYFAEYFTEMILIIEADFYRDGGNGVGGSGQQGLRAPDSFFVEQFNQAAVEIFLQKTAGAGARESEMGGKFVNADRPGGVLPDKRADFAGAG